MFVHFHFPLSWFFLKYAIMRLEIRGHLFEVGSLLALHGFQIGDSIWWYVAIEIDINNNK